MKQYAPFVHQLENLFRLASQNPESFSTEIEAATNGQAKQELYSRISQSSRRKHGAFFTGEETAELAASFLQKTIENGATIYDPACGAGDLILACCKYLPVKCSLRATLAAWDSRIFGTDIHHSFVDACRLRLSLKCIERTGMRLVAGTNQPVSFRQVKVACGLKQQDVFRKVGAVIMNPPFTSMDTPSDVGWASGSINSSAVFVARVLANLNAGAKLVAILPDVLRSGTRYEKWRETICQLAKIQHVVPLDQFDRSTDVHVFVLVATRTKEPSSRSTFVTANLADADTKTLDDLFRISVGPVVEYREPNKGKWFPYLTARDLPVWTKITGNFPKRRFRGRKVRAPFVVVRRTSRPEDEHRAVGTIVGGKNEFAVENHLVILEPKDGRLKSCQNLLRVLRCSETTSFLNRAIRCRHLTVPVIKSIPWVVPLSEQA